jgi:serine/threonine protein kinase
MELFGTSVRKIISTKGVYSLKEALSVAIDVVRLLKDLHGLGIVHGDVSWGNVLIKDDAVRLIDFDRAVFADGLTTGKPSLQGRHKLESHWMLSDLLDGKELVYADDIFGVYEMIAAMTKGQAYYNAMIGLKREKILKAKRGKLIENPAAFYQFTRKAEAQKLIDEIHSAVHTKAKLPSHERLIQKLQALKEFLDAE